MPNNPRRLTRLTRRLVTGALAVAATMAALLVYAPPAEAAYYVEMKNFSTQRCLDDSSRGVRVRACDNTSNQDWLAPTTGSGQIRNRNTNRCLVDSFDRKLRTVPCNSAVAYQIWYAIPDDTRRYVIYQNNGTRGCLDDSIRFSVRSFGCNNLRYQLWNVGIG